MLPWALYNLTARDLTGPQVHAWHNFDDTSVGAAATSVTSIFTVPAEHYALLTSVAFSAIDSPATGMVVEYVNLALTDQNGIQRGNWKEYRRQGPYVVEYGTSWEGSPFLLVPERWTLALTTTISGVPGAAYPVQHTVSGVLIPKGTLAV